jgi:CheY-like chemotaxis protein
MATVLVIEPHPEVRELLIRVVRRLGHEVVLGDESYTPTGQHVDAVLVEPAHEPGLDAAAPLVQSRGASLVCVSIYPPSERVRELGPVAYLQKPFTLGQLEQALVSALLPLETAQAG